MDDRICIVMAVLVREGRVLMVHRHPLREAYPDRWALPGGHVESGELPDQAVRRECREELGVQVDDPQPFPMAVADVDLDTCAFLVTQWTGEIVNAAPEEHDALRWARATDLAELNLAHPETLPNIVSAIRAVAERTEVTRSLVLPTAYGEKRDNSADSG